MADLHEQLARLEELDAQVIAASSDGLDDARGTVEELGLEFTVLYGLDAEETSRKIGCFTGKRQGRPHVQPAGFILTRDGVIALAVYSTGKVGRLTTEDAVTILQDLKHKE